MRRVLHGTFKGFGWGSGQDPGEVCLRGVGRRRGVAEGGSGGARTCTVKTCHYVTTQVSGLAPGGPFHYYGPRPEREKEQGSLQTTAEQAAVNEVCTQAL